MKNLITFLSKKMKFNEFKSFLETNKQIADLRHGYNGSLPPKVFLDFEKTLFGKIFKILGSLSLTITLIFRAAITPESESFLAYIHDREYFVVMLAIFGFVYSVYLLISSFLRFKNSIVYLIKGKWIKRNSPLDIKGSMGRIVGSLLSNTGAAIKVTGGIAATGLTIDQVQDLFGVSENNDWRLKKNTVSLGRKLGISDKINNRAPINNKIEIEKGVYDKLQQDSKILQALKTNKSKSEDASILK